MTAAIAASLTGPAYPAAAALEAVLGNSDDPANPTGFAAAVRRDSSGATGTAIANAARSVGLQLSYIPAELGGSLVTFEQTLARVRLFARRDASVMPSTMFSVTAMTCLLLHGSTEQQRRAVAVLKAGGSIAFALSEPDSGSDLLALAGTLTPVAAAWQLDATKWLVGQGSTSELLYVLARTAARGPAAFSSVLIESTSVVPGTVTASQHSAGLTGVGLDTLRFDAQPVAAQDLVGTVGQGLEAAMKSMQIVRLLSAAASLGCADVAIRDTLRFLATHSVGGSLCLNWAPARRDLGVAAGWLIAMDAVAISAARLVHVRPDAFALPSAVVKRVATEAGARIVDACADLQASRSVLAGEPYGLLAKLRRDVDTVRYIDTSPAATLRLLAGQLPGIAKAAAAPGGKDQEVLDRAARVFTLGAELDEYQPTRLDLATRDDDAVSAFHLLAQPMIELLLRSSDPLAGPTLVLVQQTRQQLDGLLRQVRAESGNPARDGGVQAMDSAAEFAALYAAACCLLLWWSNREQSVWGQPPGSLRWLTPALAVLVTDRPRPEDLEPAVDLLSELDERAMLFSMVAIPLTQSRGAR
ncbi:MAG TPA: acyl-CoA dehydrogenase family protein [Jatrophihabitans sp.]|jgi:alkylation response protein AidB-like acyl-CoA dehydrogenase|uniref:acyl-CoA dehydrogenase family protein n=1 Tax=Jatrophihabitans sp. TaxID=1932789 RepID=UPI002F25A4F9